MGKKKGKPQSDISEIPRHVVITFVKPLEKAEQYFELKDRLRGRDDVQYYLGVPEELIKGMVEEVKADGYFKMLDEEDILHAAEMIERELVYTHYSEIAPAYIRQELQTTNTAEISAEEMKIRIWEAFPFLSVKCDDPQRRDYYVYRDPMYFLVYQKRAEGFVPNPNPRVEIKQIQKKFPIDYYTMFLAEGSKYKRKIVTFKCVGCEDVAKLLELLFSDCGEIASFDIISLDKQSELVHVTFGDVPAADEALCFAANGFPGKEHLIGDQKVDVIPVPYHELPWVAPSHIKPEEVKAAKRFAKNVENELYEYALAWYQVFFEDAEAKAPEKVEGSKRTKKSKARKARRRAEAREALGSPS